jgi:hypothetical protein
VLILSLSRFEYDKQTWQRVKNGKKFPFPSELDMKPFMEDSAKQERTLYDLFGVVIHRGEHASHGHYHANLLDILNESGMVGKPRGQLVKGCEETDEGKFAGWFDFNDSMVEPITEEAMKAQYGGAKQNECAYMLIYRQRDCKMLSLGDIPQLPLHLEEEIRAENEALKVRRAEWEEMKNKIEIVLYTPLMLEEGREEIICLKDDKGKEDDDDEEEEEDAEGDCERDVMRPVKILIDRYQPLADLKARASEIFGDIVPPVEELQMHRVRFIGGSNRMKFIRPLNRPLAKDGTEMEYDDSAILDSLSTVTHGCEVLVWDGKQLFDGVPYEVSYDLITLCISFYEADGKCRKFDLQIKESSNIGELHRLVQQHEQLDETQELVLHRVDYAKLSELSDKSKSLRELYLNDHVCVSAELKSEDAGAESQAQVAFSGRGEMLEVFVTNNCDATFLKDAVECGPSMTIWDLKKTILEKIGTLNERMPMRLRRTTAGGGEGELFQNETVTLKKAGLDNHMRIIIEYGEPPDATHITVKFTWGTVSGTKLLSEMQNVGVEVSLKLGKLKEQIAQALKFEGALELYRLRRTDIWGNQKEIFDDEDKSLKSLGFKDCDCVWIEEGVIPPKGMLELEMDCQKSLWDIEGRNEVALGQMASNVWDTTNVGTLQILKSANLSVLRAAIRADEALGKVVEGYAFRLWHKGKLLRGENKTLKKLGLTTSGSVSIQVLKGEHDDPTVVEDQGKGMVLLMRKRNVVEKAFEPLQETVLAAQRKSNQFFVTIHELVSHVNKIAGITTPEPLMIAKFVPQSGRWRIVVEPFESTAGKEEEAPLAVVVDKEQLMEGARALSKKQKERKKANEVYFSDGDLIVWKRLSEDPNEEDNFVQVLNRCGEVYKSTRTGRGTQNVQRPKEVGLSISDDGW